MRTITTHPRPAALRNEFFEGLCKNVTLKICAGTPGRAYTHKDQLNADLPPCLKIRDRFACAEDKPYAK